MDGMDERGMRDYTADKPKGSNNDEALHEGLLGERDRAVTAVEFHRTELERNLRIARSCNAALEQLQMHQDYPPEDLSPLSPNEVAGAAVVAASGSLHGPGPLDGPRA